MWCDLQEPIQRYHYDESRDLLRDRFGDPTTATDADLMGILTEDSFGDDAVFRSVMARVRLGPDGLDEVRLHPVDLGRGEPLTRRGIPRTPTPEVAQSILEAIGSMSERFSLGRPRRGTGLVRGV